MKVGQRAITQKFTATISVTRLLFCAIKMLGFLQKKICDERNTSKPLSLMNLLASYSIPFISLFLTEQARALYLTSSS